MLPNQEIRMLIKHEGYSQAQVAKAMGISNSYFEKLLAHGDLPDKWIHRVFKALRILESYSVDHKKRVMDWLKSDNPNVSDYYKKYFVIK